ncbi:hypothetical protein [Paraburkholderia sp. BCC1886]|uniref:hypothetical protein n=1 Tax=Paraburkholderia sp. BCC1886 TaxID=2562670 RepID=UPI0016435340|nr:hypothetical protein [Paraburkholderia sp. BCC1886]
MERLARLLPFRQFGRLRHLRKLVPCSLLAASAASTAHNLSLFDTPADFAADISADISVDFSRRGSAVPSAPVSGSGSRAGAAAALPSSLPAFARVSLNAGLNTAEPARRAPVRVYHGPSRLIMVGNVDAVCRMIDRCIADEANVHGAVFEG